MSDAPAAEIAESLYDGLIEFTVAAVGGGKVDLQIDYTPADDESEKVIRRNVGKNVFSEPTPRGKFLNDAEENLAAYETIDAARARNEIRELFDELSRMGDEVDADLVDPELSPLLENTEYPVRVFADGEETTFEVDTTFKGKSGTLEFTASELNSDSGAVIATKITNTFFELVEVDGEDWKIIRRQWTAEGNKEVKFANPMTPDEAIAEHVVDGLAKIVRPTTEREKLANDPGVAWYDEDNKLGYENAGDEETILWVQDPILTDQLENAGKKVQYKGQLVKNMISNGAVYGKGVRKKLPSLILRKKLYPFKPEALGVSWEDVSFQAPADADNDETDMEITP